MPVRQLMLSRHTCQSCGAIVQPHWLIGALSSCVIFGASAAFFLLILASEGFYAALLLLPLPIGALGFLKARFCPLQAAEPEGIA